MQPPDSIPLSDDLRTIRVREVRDRPRLAWAEGRTFCVPQSVLLQTGLARAASSGDEIVDVTVSSAVAAAEPSVVDALRMRAAFTPPPMSSRLPFSYHWVPSGLRSVIAGIQGRRQRSRLYRWARFPQWPLDLSVDFLNDLRLGENPASSLVGKTPVVLSHDLDSPEGLQNCVRYFLPLEEQVGAKSSNYIVPCAWPIDRGVLRDMDARGHELGVHGYDHGNRTPFAKPVERRRRLSAALPLVQEFKMVGYRAPSLLRSPELIEDLAAHYVYDGSIPTSGGLFPTPNNGCATARAFYLDSLLELPLTMPRDGSLRFLGYSPHEILELWKASAAAIAASRGIVMLLTHCEARFSGNPLMLAVYREFLEWIAASEQFEFRTAKHLAEACAEARQSNHIREVA